MNTRIIRGLAAGTLFVALVGGCQKETPAPSTNTNTMSNEGKPSTSAAPAAVTTPAPSAVAAPQAAPSASADAVSSKLDDGHVAARKTISHAETQGSNL